jgi:hypothetical protein
MKNIDLLEVVAKVFALVGSQDTQRQADQGPEVHHLIMSLEVFAEFVDLRVAVVAGRHAIGGARGLDLLVLEPAVTQPGFLVAGLQEPTPTAAAIVIGTVGHHIDEVLLPHHGFDNEAQILGNGIAVALAYDLAGVLDGELDAQILVPIGIDLQLALPDPTGIIFVNILDLEAVGNVEFFQSCQD